MIHKTAQFLCSVAILLMSSGCDERLAFDPDSVEGLKTVLTEDSISFDGKQISLPLKIDTLIGELGEPDETHSLHNTIRVWNELGIYCYTTPGSPDVHDISFGFSFEDFDFHPTKSFLGVVSVGADNIHKGTNRANLRTMGFKSEPDLPDEYVKEVGEISIYVDTQNAKITSASFALPESGAEQDAGSKGG